MSAERHGLRRADRLIGGGALVLAISLFFFKWYEATLRLGGKHGLKLAGGDFNGWHAFTHSRWLWLITIIVALGAVWLRVDDRDVPIGAPLGGVVAALGALSTLAILFRIFHHPLAVGETPPGHATVTAAASIKFGIWIALVASAVIAIGGVLALRDELAHEDIDEPPRPNDREPAEEGSGGHDSGEHGSQAFSGLLAEDPPAEPPARAGG